MRKDDAEVMREIQKNTEMAMKAIEALAPNVNNDSFATQLTRQELKYSEIHDRVTKELAEQKMESYRTSGMQEMMLKAGVRTNTLFNTSTSHLAELMIKGSSQGLTDMWKTLNHCENAGNVSVEIASELMDFEEKSIERWKKYL